MKRLAAKTLPGITLTVDKLDSGKFQLSLLIAGDPPLHRYRARTIEELVPISLSGHPANMYPEAVRDVVYDADDAEYASHSDERAEHIAWCAEQDRKQKELEALVLKPHSNRTTANRRQK